MSPTRRSYLALLASTGLTGCSPLTDPESPASTDSPSPSRASSSVDLRLLDDWRGRELTVYPGPLRDLLREAAKRRGTLRDHARAYVQAPEPWLASLEQVRLDGPNLDGVYDVTAEGGPRYPMLFGAEAVDPPADATVRPLAELSGHREELAEGAIAGDSSARAYPETRLGEWARREWLDGYFAGHGTVYLGHEVQQTDTAFSSTEVWYTLSLSPAEADEPVTLRFPEVPPSARELLDPAFAEWERGDDGPTLSLTSGEVASFARETDALCLHTATFGLVVDA